MFSESSFSFKMNPKNSTATNVKMKNAMTITEDLYYREAETSTRAQMVDAEVSQQNTSWLAIV